jgi:hypothetical protein
MAIDLNKFKKKVEKRLPILFLVEEQHYPGISSQLILQILGKCVRENIHAELMLVSYGLSWNFRFPKLKDSNSPQYAPLEQVDLGEINTIICDLPEAKQTLIGSALGLSKAILDDPDTTKPDRYKPVVVIIASRVPAQGWENCLENLLNNGRSSNAHVYWVDIGKVANGILDSIISENVDINRAANDLMDSIINGKSSTDKYINPLKKYKNITYKALKESSNEKIANEIVSSFKLEPLDEVPTEDPVEFTTPGFDGDFGDGADAKGDGVV